MWRGDNRKMGDLECYGIGLGYNNGVMCVSNYFILGIGGKSKRGDCFWGFKM